MNIHENSLHDNEPKSEASREDQASQPPTPYEKRQQVRFSSALTLQSAVCVLLTGMTFSTFIGRQTDTTVLVMVSLLIALAFALFDTAIVCVAFFRQGLSTLLAPAPPSLRKQLSVHDVGQPSRRLIQLRFVMAAPFSGLYALTMCVILLWPEIGNPLTDRELCENAVPIDRHEEIVHHDVDELAAEQAGNAHLLADREWQYEQSEARIRQLKKERIEVAGALDYNARLVHVHTVLSTEEPYGQPVQGVY